MIERVMPVDAIAPYLVTTFRTSKVKVRESAGEISIIPFNEAPEIEEKMRRLYELCDSASDLEKKLKHGVTWKALVIR